MSEWSTGRCPRCKRTIHIENGCLPECSCGYTAEDGDTEAHKIRAALQRFRWKSERNYGGQREITSPNRDLQVTLDDHGWRLGKFTDSDLHGVATGRFEDIAEGVTLDELLTAIDEAEAA